MLIQEDCLTWQNHSGSDVTVRFLQLHTHSGGRTTVLTGGGKQWTGETCDSYTTIKA